jgi:hypothetical protein
MANFLKSLFVKGVEIDPAGAASDQVLKYNGTKFVPGTASTVGSIDDLSDVIVTTPSNGQALVYNGTDWVNGASGVAGSTYTATIGDGTNDVFVLSHGLNTRDVFVTIRNAASPYEVIDAYWAATTTGTVTIDFSVVPTINSVRVAIYAAVTGNNTALALDTLTDVVISTPANGQFLEFDGTNWVNKVSPSNEPMGHENKADSVISFNEGTRTFSIAPASTSYTVWCAGKRFVKTTTSTVIIPDTSGLYYIYFDSSGVLSYRTSYFVWDTDAPTAYIYWNEVDNKAYFFADERHGITLDWATHEYLHRTRGAAIANGFGISWAAGNGSSDTDAKFDLANGTFFDEDLQVDVTHSATPIANTWEQTLQGNAEIPSFYRDGDHWKKDNATEFAFKQGSGRPKYNLYSGGAWTTATAQNGYYIISWIVATNNLNEPILSIMGQTAYVNQGLAEEALWEDLDLSALPIHEFRPLHKIIYKALDTYTNSVNARIVLVTDIRQILSTDGAIPSTPVSDHGSMTGLADDDHTQYLTDTRHNALDHSTAMASVVIDDLSDVAITSPANGEILKYNSATSLWTNASAGGVVVLNDLTDVSAATPITSQPLIWDGTNWQSGSFNQYLRLGESGVTDWLQLSPQSLQLNPSAGLARFSYYEVVINDTVYQAELLPQELKWTDWSNGNQTKIQPIGATNGQVLAFNTGSSSYVPSNIPIDSLSDVVITSPTDGQVLKYNTATSLWTNASAGGGASITVSDTPPVSPTAGALWFESDSGLTFIYYDSQWIEIGAGASYDPITGTIQAKGDLILGTASQTVDRLTVGSNSQRLIANSSTATGVSWASDSTNTVIDTKGDLLVGATADVVAKLPVGTDNQVLVADSTATNGVSWQSKPFNTAWGTIAYQQATSNSAGFSSETVMLTTSAFTAIAGRRYKITYFESGVSTLSGTVNFIRSRIRLTNISGTILNFSENAIINQRNNTTNFCITTSLSGSVTVCGTLEASGGGSGICSRSSDSITHILVEDIGPA